MLEEYDTIVGHVTSAGGKEGRARPVVGRIETRWLPRTTASKRRRAESRTH